MIKNLSFDEHGATVIRNAFPSDSLRKIKAEFSSLLKHYCGKNNISFNSVSEALIRLKERNNRDLIRFQRTFSRSSAFYSICSSSVLCDSLRECMSIGSDDPLYYTNNGVIFTFPNCSQRKSTNISLDWHKDTFFTIPKSRFVHFWSPLFHNANEQIGTLKVCLESHKDGLGKQKYNPDATFNYMYSAEGGEIDKYEKMSMEVKEGEALIFDSRVWHASGINSSSRVRITALGLVHDTYTENFKPITTSGYIYDGLSPEQYYYEIYGDDSISARISELNNVESSEEPQAGS